ncbi:MAG: four helix bundle protein [Clostridiales bacterium]|nr:four helix bundle protein [Clostridiales bacterium]
MSNTVEDKSFKFAIRIVKLYKYLTQQQKEYVLSKQLLRSGTSIGANIAEAQQAQSRADFISKMNIALKEAAEAKYWIKLLTATKYLNQRESVSVLSECIEIEKLLFSIVRTSKANL